MTTIDGAPGRTDLAALEQAARAAMSPFEVAGARHRDATWLAMEPNERGDLWTREMLAEMYFMACYDRRALLGEYDRLIAAVREADALDVERLAKTLDNLWERRWGPWPMPKGQTTVNLENAEAIAAEYAALSPTEPAEDAK